MDFNSPRPTVRAVAHRTCRGTGFRKGYEHVWHGGCFGCSGTGEVGNSYDAKKLAKWEAIQDAALIIPIDLVRPGMVIDGKDSAIVGIVLRRSRKIDSTERDTMRPNYFIQFADGSTRKVQAEGGVASHREVRLSAEGNVPGLFR